MDLEDARIAVVKLGAIGDAVNALPFVCRLRDALPRARITWVIGEPAHALLAGHRAVDEFLVVDVRRVGRWPSIARELRARRFELAIDLQRILKSGVLTRLTGAPLRLGFDRARCKEASFLFTNRRIAPNPQAGVTVEQYLEFADHLGLAPSAPRFDLPDEPWRGPPPPDGRPRVCVNVGASKPANRWEPARFGELADRLAGELGAEVHLTGGPTDRAAADAALAAARSSEPVDQVGALSLKQSAGLIRSSQLFVGCDTGPLHVAVAVGTPVVALFGAADPRRTGPFRSPESVVSRPAPCSPCRQRVCTVAGHPCMSDVTVRDVFERARALLERNAGPWAPHAP